MQQRVLEKETQLHLAHKELEKFKEQLKSAETTKSQAARELEKANRTLQELTCKLETASESKQAEIAATEAAKNRARELEEAKSSLKEVQVDSASWKQAVDSEREQYKVSAAELIGAKQKLTNIRQDFDAALDKKLSAFQEAADAQHATKVNRERLNELSKEIAMMRETLGQVKIAIVQAQDEQAKNAADKEARLQFLKTAKEEAEKKMLLLKEEESELKLSGNLEEKLEETTEAITVIQEQLKNVRESDLISLQTATLELEDAKNALEQVFKEECLLRSSVDSLQLDLDVVKKDCCEWKEKETKSESVSENLRVELERSKEELEAALAEEIKKEEASNDMQSTLQQLSSETNNARRESEELKKSVEDLKREAETTRNLEKETEEKLQAALKEAEEAKAAAKVVNDQIHLTPLSTDSKNSETKDKIKLSAEEYKSLRKKVEEFEKLGQMKVADAMAEVEAIKMRGSEAAKRLDEGLKEIRDMKTATEDSLKKAEMAEAAKQVVEGELRKWRQQEENKAAAETSSNREEMEYI